MLKLHKINSAIYSCVPNCFYFFDDQDSQGGVFKVMKKYHFLAFFSHLDPFYPRF